MKKTLCTICNIEISNNNFIKHSKKCHINPRYTPITHDLKCEFCSKEFKTAVGNGLHRTQCKLNPNSKDNWNIGRSGWNRGKTKDTDLRIMKMANNMVTAYASGQRKLSGAVTLTSEELSKNAKDQGFGGYRENAGRSKKFKVHDSFGKQTTLQSTFELRCAEILNELGIKWKRPPALKYDNKNYFADFYLPDYDIWLDPKNNYKAKKDEEKINKVIEQNKVKLYVLLEEQLTPEYIKWICR